MEIGKKYQEASTPHDGRYACWERQGVCIRHSHLLFSASVFPSAVVGSLDRQDPIWTGSSVRPLLNPAGHIMHL